MSQLPDKKSDTQEKYSVSEKLKILISLIGVKDIDTDQIKDIGKFSVFEWRGKTYAVYNTGDATFIDKESMKVELVKMKPELTEIYIYNGLSILAQFATNGKYNKFDDSMATHIKISKLVTSNLYRPSNMMAKYGLGRKTSVNMNQVKSVLREAGFNYDFS